MPTIPSPPATPAPERTRTQPEAMGNPPMREDGTDATNSAPVPATPATPVSAALVQRLPWSVSAHDQAKAAAAR